MQLRSGFRGKYLYLGFTIGLVFPIAGCLLKMVSEELPISFENFWAIQQTEPLVWIIDLAPWILAFCAYLIGVKQDKLNLLNNELTFKLDKQIRELANSNTQLRTEIDERRATEEKLTLAVKKAEDASLAKSEFLSTMSHEIRTPLNAVIGMTGILMDTKLSGQQIDFVRTIKVGGESLLSVINDILDYSKIEAGMLELEEQAFNTLDPIEDVADLLSGKIHKKKLEFMYELGEGVPAAISSDLTRLRQVLVNLVGNAIKFTEQGEIQIRVRSLGKEDGKDVIQFEVKDTGIGIPKEKIGRLFKSFSQVDASTTRKYGGTGLGLAICKKIVEAMGGRIWVESEEGNGSSFFFTVKVRLAEVRRFEMLDAITIFKGKKVLLVDDNQTNLDILGRQCENWGFDVTSFTNPFEALAFCQKDRAGNSFDLCITDMQMPEMDGVILSKRLKEGNKDFPPMILLSSIDQSSIEEDKKRFDYLLNKPAKVEQLFNAMARLLGWKAREAKKKDENKEDRKAAAGIRILLAEDNPVNQKVAKHMLKKLGANADIAGNGKEAFDMACQFPYDLILMDMQMPIMGGLESTEKILAFYATNKDYQPSIIAMTANSSNEDREICFQSGMKDFISKPVKIDKLKEIIETYTQPTLAG